jgi:hypothetical protein
MPGRFTTEVTSPPIYYITQIKVAVAILAKQTGRLSWGPNTYPFKLPFLRQTTRLVSWEALGAVA